MEIYMRIDTLKLILLCHFDQLYTCTRMTRLASLHSYDGKIERKEHHYCSFLHICTKRFY